MGVKITVKDIKLITDKLISKWQDVGIKEFEFDYDEYWVILTEEWTKFDIIPSPAVGSLSDDIGFLKSTLENDESISYLELERLASVFRAIGNQL